MEADEDPARRASAPTPSSSAASTSTSPACRRRPTTSAPSWPTRATSRVKREALVDRLIGSQEYVEYWTNKWADLLQVNRKFLGVEGAVAFRNWIRDQVAANTPYDQFVRAILTASGSNQENPPASYFKILREPDGDRWRTRRSCSWPSGSTATSATTTRSSAGPRTSTTRRPPTSPRSASRPTRPAAGRMIGGTAVEAAKPLYEMVADTGRRRGHARPDQAGRRRPSSRSTCAYRSRPRTRRAASELAAWLTSTDNPYFARSYVNRLWGYLFGVGIIEPLDDIRAGNPPTNPELLDYLTDEFVKSGFDVRHVDPADLQVADLSALGRDEQVERGRQGQLLARHRPAAAGRGAARRGLPRDRLGVEVPGRRRRDAGGGPARLGRRAAQRLPRPPSAARPARAPASASGPAACSSARSWPWSAARRSATRSPTRPTS